MRVDQNWNGEQQRGCCFYDQDVCFVGHYSLARDAALVVPIAEGRDLEFDGFQLAFTGSFSLIRRERQRMWSYAPALGSAMANALPRVHARRASSVSPRSHMMEARAIQ